MGSGSLEVPPSEPVRTAKDLHEVSAEGLHASRAEVSITLAFLRWCTRSSLEEVSPDQHHEEPEVGTLAHSAEWHIFRPSVAVKSAGSATSSSEGSLPEHDAT